jgi:hypothetical protein
MHTLPDAVRRTPAELEARIAQRMDDALRLRPDSAEHRSIMKEISRLRIYADAKRWMLSHGRKQAK